MEESSEKGLKQERERRKRIAQIKRGIICIVGIYILLSMVVCTVLAYKVHNLEQKLQYLLDNFTVSGHIDAKTQQGNAEADESAYFDLEGAAQPDESVEEPYILPAVNQQENLAGQNDTHKVYLTFDDGPSSNTAEILDILKQYGVKATFFVIGKENEESKELYRRMVEEGHTLAMHSYSHKYGMLYESVEAFAEDFSNIQNYLFEVTGQECLFYRFPGGSSNQVSKTDMKELIAYLNGQGITYFDWNVSS